MLDLGIFNEINKRKFPQIFTHPNVSVSQLKHLVSKVCFYRLMQLTANKSLYPTVSSIQTTCLDHYTFASNSVELLSHLK